MTQSRDTASTDIQIGSNPAERAGAVKLLSESRQATSIKTAIYAFGALLRG